MSTGGICHTLVILYYVFRGVGDGIVWAASTLRLQLHVQLLALPIDHPYLEGYPAS